eukprot:3273583-Pleurochrysis_carterae.AAC.1
MPLTAARLSHPTRRRAARAIDVAPPGGPPTARRRRCGTGRGQTRARPRPRRRADRFQRNRPTSPGPLVRGGRR